MHSAERSGKTEVPFFTADVCFTVIRLRSRANSRSGTKNFARNILEVQYLSCSCSNYYDWEETMIKKKIQDRVQIATLFLGTKLGILGHQSYTQI